MTLKMTDDYQDPWFTNLMQTERQELKIEPVFLDHVNHKLAKLLDFRADLFPDELLDFIAQDDPNPSDLCRVFMILVRNLIELRNSDISFIDDALMSYQKQLVAYYKHITHTTNVIGDFAVRLHIPVDTPKSMVDKYLNLARRIMRSIDENMTCFMDYTDPVKHYYGPKYGLSYIDLYANFLLQTKRVDPAEIVVPEYDMSYMRNAISNFWGGVVNDTTHLRSLGGDQIDWLATTELNMLSLKYVIGSVSKIRRNLTIFDRRPYARMMVQR